MPPRFSGLVATLFAASSADTQVAGQVAAVPRFNGSFSEGFEGFPVVFPIAQLDCFDDMVTATRVRGLQGLLVLAHVISYWGNMEPRSGSRYMCSGTEVIVEWEFDQPARRFGGYFGTLYAKAGASAEFYNASGTLMATMPVIAPNAAWEWNGWRATGVGFKRVRIVPLEACCGVPYGSLVMHDDLELDFVCAADCNANGALALDDFQCFQASFAAGQPAADCNQSGTLTIADFACFQSKFVAGCP